MVFTGTSLVIFHMAKANKSERMKRIFFLAAIVFMGQLANAQSKPDSSPAPVEKKVVKGDYITLQAGQVIMVKENKAEKLDSDKQLPDGTMVTIDGTIKRADGTSFQMKEGDRIYLDGGMSLSKRDKALM